MLSEVHRGPSLPPLYRIKWSGAANASLDLSSAQCVIGQPQIDALEMAEGQVLAANTHQPPLPLMGSWDGL